MVNKNKDLNNNPSLAVLYNMRVKIMSEYDAKNSQQRVKAQAQKKCIQLSMSIGLCFLLGVSIYLIKYNDFILSSDSSFESLSLKGTESAEKQDCQLSISKISDGQIVNIFPSTQNTYEISQKDILIPSFYCSSTEQKYAHLAITNDHGNTLESIINNPIYYLKNSYFSLNIPGLPKKEAYFYEVPKSSSCVKFTLTSSKNIVKEAPTKIAKHSLVLNINPEASN